MSLSEAARVMVEHQVNHVLVADSGGRPVGVVSTTDVARRFAAAGQRVRYASRTASLSSDSGIVAPAGRTELFSAPSG